jgi:hypothetical protein
MSYRVILDRGLTIAERYYQHGDLLSGGAAGPEIEAALKAGHLEKLKEETAKPAAKPAEKEG